MAQFKTSEPERLHGACQMNWKIVPGDRRADRKDYPQFENPKAKRPSSQESAASWSTLQVASVQNLNFRSTSSITSTSDCSRSQL